MIINTAIAIAAQADYIITEDKHFRVVENRSFPPLHLLGIDNFMALIKSQA